MRPKTGHSVATQLFIQLVFDAPIEPYLIHARVRRDFFARGGSRLTKEDPSFTRLGRWV